jgi:hypothetical protein
MLSIFWEVSVSESFVSAFRSPVTGFGERIYRTVNVLAVRVCRYAEEVELGEDLQTILVFDQESVKVGRTSRRT